VSLSLLSLFVVVLEAWFLNLKSGISDTAEKVTSAPNSRKVILVAKKVYVPMYASDDTASAVADRLLPFSPALTPSDGIVTDGRHDSYDWTTIQQHSPLSERGNESRLRRASASPSSSVSSGDEKKTGVMIEGSLGLGLGRKLTSELWQFSTVAECPVVGTTIR
jgi:hypothetical protein